MSEFDRSGEDGQTPGKHRRRPRYSGTHPKSYAQKYKEHNLAAYPQIEAHLRAKGNTPAGTHVPVLVEDVVACLRPGPGDIVVDCTVGYGGHASEFLKRIGPDGRLIGLDVDAAELERTRSRLGQAKGPQTRTTAFGNPSVLVSFYRSNFAGIAKVLSQEKLDGFDILFADLGVSSMQIDNPERGMSYKHEGPLDMRMDDRLKQTGADLLNSLPEDELAKALWELADEPDHRRIAHLIAARRAVEPITQTSQLVQLVLDAKGLNPKTWRQQHNAARASRPCTTWRGRPALEEQGQDGLATRKGWKPSPHGSLHPAARTFQTLRILVNDELGSLRELLRVVPYCLRPGGRIGIISFHSGEDRLVKQSFRDGVRNGMYAAAVEEVIVPRIEEIRSNPRSASAKFRWAVKPPTE